MDRWRLPLVDAVVLLLVLTFLQLLPAVRLPSLHAQQGGTSFLAALQADLDAATVVLQAIVTSTTPTQDGVTGIITSSVTLQKSVVLKGTHAATSRTVTIVGGTVAGITQGVESTPQLTQGDRVIVLLDENFDPMPGRYLYKLGATSDTIEDPPNLTLATIRGLL